MKIDICIFYIEPNRFEARQDNLHNFHQCSEDIKRPPPLSNSALRGGVRLVQFLFADLFVLSIPVPMF